MNIELTRIAEKKLEQMGATVHGVLVKNEAGAWAAVSDAGRVMWLDDFEGQTARAQGEGEAVAKVCVSESTGDWAGSHVSVEWLAKHKVEEGDELFLHPSAGAVPEGWKLVPVESTSDMDLAAEDADLDKPVDRDHAEAIWSAMIAAAPTAPAVEGGGAPEYVCHSCGNQTQPPAPYSVYVKCPCGATTAATIAADLAKNTHPHNGEQGGEWVIQLRGEYLATRGIWERPDHRGYTNDIHEAGRYSEDEARKSEAMAPEKYKAVCLSRLNPPTERED